MIVEYVRYRIDAGRAAAFEAAYGRAATSLQASPECVDYELTRCVEEPDRYVLRIHWTSHDDHLVRFRGSEAFGSFFAEIGEFVDAIEEMQHYERTPVAGDGGGADKPPTLYDWAGGIDAFRTLFRRFYDRVVVDEVLGPLFAGMDPDHPDHVAVWLGEVFGGPDAYTRDHGGYEQMLAHHRGKAITEQQRRRWVELLVDAADDVGLPSDPEFRAAFMSYIEWGTRLAVANSQPDAEPMPHAPVPRWGWGVAPPWLG